VVRGIHFVVSSIGLPLEFVLEVLQKNNMLVDWIDYYENAVKQGSKSDRIVERIHNCVNDFYGIETGNGIIKRLKSYITDRNKNE
jgi:hypothetical protein